MKLEGFETLVSRLVGTRMLRDSGRKELRYGLDQTFHHLARLYGLEFSIQEQENVELNEEFESLRKNLERDVVAVSTAKARNKRAGKKVLIDGGIRWRLGLYLAKLDRFYRSYNFDGDVLC